MPEITKSKYRIDIGWDDVPHLDEAEKERMLDGTLPYLRKARKYGIPSLGAGAIYPIDEEEVVCEAFQIPPHWPLAYGFDVGWKRSAAIWGAWDRESDIIYLWSEHYRGEAEPSIHADAIKRRADWIPGAIDPAAKGRSQLDGEHLLQAYLDLGLILVKADNAVEAGLLTVWQRLSTGRLKIFKHLLNTLAEYRMYARDENGKVVKTDDHLMDAIRYLISRIREIACTAPYDYNHEEHQHPGSDGRDAATGY